MPGGYLTRKALVLAKTETTEGTDAVPTGSANALLVINPQPTLNGEQINRDIVKNTLSPLGWIIGTKTMGVTFSTEVRGRGAVPTLLAPLRDDPLFIACGMIPDYTTGCVYSPESDPIAGQRSCTIYVYLGNAIVLMLLGCKGNLEIVQEVGQFAKFNWTFQATFAKLAASNVGGIQDQAAPTPTFDATAVKPLPFMGAGTFVSHTFDACIQSITWNLNNEIQQRVCSNADNGIEGFLITNRNPGGTFNPEMTTRADHDWWLRWQDATDGVIETLMDGGVGNTVRITAGAAQYGTPAFGDRNGIRILDVPFSANEVTSAGDDELAVSFE